MHIIIVTTVDLLFLRNEPEGRREMSEHEYVFVQQCNM